MVHVEIWMHQTHDCLGLRFFLNCYINVQIIKIKQLQVKYKGKNSWVNMKLLFL